MYVPSLELGLSHLPLSPASVPLPPVPKGGGGAHSPADEGSGESQFRRLEKKLSTLPTLCFPLINYFLSKGRPFTWRGISATCARPSSPPDRWRNS